MTAKFEIEIRFRTRDKQLELLLIDNGRWSEFDFIRKELESRNARVPNDRHDALYFVRELTRKTPLRPKFAIFYAAGQVGVQSGLLPWPVDWPMRAVRHCYENSLNERDPDVAATNKAVWLLAKSLNSKDGFPKFVVKKAHYPLWRDDQIGFHRVNGGRCETFLAKERLDRVCDEFVVDSSVFRRLIELKVVNQGAYTSAPPIEGSISRWWHCENTLLEAGRSSVKAMGKSHGARPVPQGSTKTRFQSISHDLEFDHRGEGGRETEGSYISSST